MKKIDVTPIRKGALIKLGILLPIFVFFSFGSWCSLIILLSVWSYCTYAALYGHEKDIGQKIPTKLRKLGDLSDGTSGCGSRTMRKQLRGY